MDLFVLLLVVEEHREVAQVVPVVGQEALVVEQLWVVVDHGNVHQMEGLEARMAVEIPWVEHWQVLNRLVGPFVSVEVQQMPWEAVPLKVLVVRHIVDLLEEEP